MGIRIMENEADKQIEREHGSWLDLFPEILTKPCLEVQGKYQAQTEHQHPKGKLNGN